MNKTIKIVTLVQLIATVSLALWLVQLGEKNYKIRHIASVKRKVAGTVGNARLKAIERQGESLLAHSLRVVRKTLY